MESLFGCRLRVWCQHAFGAGCAGDGHVIGCNGRQQESRYKRVAVGVRTVHSIRTSFSRRCGRHADEIDVFARIRDLADGYHHHFTEADGECFDRDGHRGTLSIADDRHHVSVYCICEYNTGARQDAGGRHI